MRDYEVTSPDGRTFVVTAPENATQEQIVAYAMQNMPSEKEAKKEPLKQKGMRALGKFSQGITFGYGDEISAFINSKIHGIPYDILHKQMQDERKQFTQENPALSTGSELVGALALGIPVGAKMAGAKVLQGMSPLLRTAAIAGTEGTVYGAGAADQGLKERAKGAAIGGGSGAVLGPVTQLGVSTAAPLVHAVGGRVKHALSGTPARDARSHLAAVLSREGFDSIDDVRKSVPQAYQGKATLADVSEGGRGALEGLVSDVRNPAITKLARDTLEGRNKQLTGRVYGSASDGLNLPVDALGRTSLKVIKDGKGIRLISPTGKPDTGINVPATYSVKDALELVRKYRGETATQLYGELRGKPIKPTPELKRLMGIDEIDSAIREAQRRVTQDRAIGSKPSHIDVFNETKKVLDGKIGRAIGANDKDAVRRLTGLKNALVKELDDQLPEYKAARDAFAGDSQLLDAAELGKKIFRTDIDDLDDIIDGLSISEKTFFRLGVQKAIREKLMMAREGTNAINRISSQLNLERLEKAFPTKAAYLNFKKQMDFEAQIFDTARVLHNSKTALRLNSKQSLDRANDISMSDSISVMEPLMSKVAVMVNKLLGREMSDEAREELGKLLLKPLSEFDSQTIGKINRQIIKQTPVSQRKRVVQFLEGIGPIGQNAPAVLGGLAVPVGAE